MTRKQLMAIEYAKSMWKNERDLQTAREAYLDGVEDTLKMLEGKQHWNEAGAYEGLTKEHPNDIVDEEINK